MTLIDATARQQALDPRGSFIVQAPAGSGKTELLTQRVLALLAKAERPEEIVAITFTRKAAAEMRERVIDSLKLAQAEQPDSPHKLLTWQLAQAALGRDETLGWDLLAFPGRLRIFTIDALCSALARQMPLLSSMGGPPNLIEDPGELLREAARATLNEYAAHDAQGEAVRHLLVHLDNDHGRAESLLVDMLQRRDQWLRALLGDRKLDREALEHNLRLVVEDALARYAAACAAIDWSALAPLLRFAAESLAAEDSASPITHCLDLAHAPGHSADALPIWRATASLLLTKDGKLRAKVDKNSGFPAGGKDEQGVLAKQRKAEIIALLESLREEDELIAALDRIRSLPDPHYSDDEWQVLAQLIKLLPIAAAQLQLIFTRTHSADFNEIARAALNALGGDGAPTDLALALDYQIKHLLVDEFQDTSVNQYDLLLRLTEGWSDGDGRTLFFVGDPMQSVYRFREAEVGIFVSVRDHGLGQVRPQALTLSTNFRSQAGVIDWVNHTFRQVMGDQDALAEGAIAYSASHAHHPALPDAAVIVHPQIGLDEWAEARQVLALIEAARTVHSDPSIAILVRTRSHAAAITQTLAQAGLAYQGLDLDALGDRPLIQDLFALTRALLHRADRTAWLALLRAPWFGLTLCDITSLLADERNLTVFSALQVAAANSAISTDGQERIQRCLPPINAAMHNIGTLPFSRLAENLWLELGGPSAARHRGEVDDARVYWQLIARMETDGNLGDLAALSSQLEKLRAAPDPDADASLQIMTVHKAKGLEFDVVIMPGLGRPTRGDSKPLLVWQEQTELAGYPLLLGPIAPPSGAESPVYTFVRDARKQADRHELSRLLYVGTTRAIKQLHLLGHVALRETKEGAVINKPRTGAFLDPLWPLLEPEYQAAFARWQSAAPETDPDDDAHEVIKPALKLRRLTTDWQAPPLPVDVPFSAHPVVQHDAVEFDWAGETVRCVGVVVHALLQRIATEGVDAWPIERLTTMTPYVESLLVDVGVEATHLTASAKQTVQAVSNALQSETARWIFSAVHTDARSEFALMHHDGVRVRRAVIDRTFIADGERWIIDYKTSFHEGGDREQFLASEEARYRAQLEKYRYLMSQMGDEPIRLGLYFPLLDAWREVK